MTDLLRDELARLADSTPALRVPDQTWRRGRKLRRRTRLLAAAASLGVLLLVAGLAGLVDLGGGASGRAEPADSRGQGAVPDMLYAVPERLMTYEEAGTAWHESVAETDLAVGRASVAFATGMGGKLPVVVTAADGAYHPLVLPGWDGSFSTVNLAGHGAAALALSPDGRSLAYGWWDPAAPLDAPMPSGVRVLDLETGEIRTVRLHGGNGIAVGSVVWSPDSRWLVWQGDESKSWTPDGYSGGRTVAGRIAPGAVESEAIPASQESTLSLAVDDDGRVSLLEQGGRWRLWDRGALAQGTVPDAAGDGVAEASLESLAAVGAMAPDGTSVALGGISPREAAAFLDPRDGAVVDRPLAAGLGLYPEGATVQPLGWMDGRTVVALVSPAADVEPDAGWTSEDPHVVLMTAPSRPRDEWTYRVVMRTDEDVTGIVPGSGSLTVAVDLMTLDEPSRTFPEPDWPWSDERKVVVGVLAATGVLALVLLGVRRWRRGPGRRGLFT